MDMQKYDFKNETLNIEINCYLDKDNNSWFRGKEIALLLDYNNTRQAIRLNVEEEDKNRGLLYSPLKNRKYNSIFINESGLYSLILNSKKPTSVVLPSIRKYGFYKLFNNYKINMVLIESEKDLHHKVVSFIRRKYDNCLMIAGLGELQTTQKLRLSAYNHNYTLSGKHCHLRTIKHKNNIQDYENKIFFKKLYLNI